MTKFPPQNSYKTRLPKGKHAAPPVPIKTYRWEDIRRQRLAGVYPWTHIQKPPFNEEEWKAAREHEYEPINPMASPQPPPPPVVKVTDMEGAAKSAGSDASSNDSRHQQFLRIPLHDEVVEDDDDVEEAGDSHPDSRPTTVEGEDVDVEKEDRILRDERFFAATPTTTESRTDGEINTSQVDSSGLDELPLKKDARRANDVRGIQQRIRSQAGRIRTKLRNISRPKINLPERPKFSFPEKAKISLPERPKFQLPERPKFNFSQRPKISMPNFSFGKTKTNSARRPLRDRNQAHSSQSTAGGKRNIFDTFRTYPRIFSKKKRASLKETQEKGQRAQTPPPKMETEDSTPSTPASRTGTFGQRWITRYRDIKFADDENQSVSQSDKQKSFDEDVEDDSAPFHDTDFGGAVTLEDHKPKRIKAESSGSIAESDKEQRSSGTSSERHRTGVLEEIDSDEFFLREKGLSREDVDVSRYLSLEIRDAFRKPKNALARLDTELYDDDIDYDFEPTVKMPGEPFRRSMEAMRRESLEPIRMTPEPEVVYEPEPEFDDEMEVEELEPVEPVRPTRTRSLRHRSQRSRSEEAKPDSTFNTFPPSRPSRGRKKSEQTDKQSIGTANVNVDDNIEENKLQTKPASIPSLAVTDGTNDLSPTRYIDESSEALDRHWHSDRQPPLPPKRRRSTKDISQDNRSLSNGNYVNEKWIEGIQAQITVPGEVTALSMEDVMLRDGYYDSPPVPPIRKQRSRGTSLADEDRTSRGAESLISETRDPDEPYEEEMMADMEPEAEIETKPNESEVIKEQQITVRDSYDYAVVEKTVTEKTVTHVTTPQRPSRPKPAHPPLPGRKERAAQHISNLKNQGINFFFTYPRRAIKSFQREAPVRPLRNYSTVGHNNNRERPARPPRRSRVFREPVYAEGEIIPLKGEDEQDKNEENKLVSSEDRPEHEKIIDMTDDLKDSTTEQEDATETRDLQSGDIIEKMKGRPLPPPPRPPRKSKDDLTHQSEFSEERSKQITDLDEPEEGDIILERIQFQIMPDNTSQPTVTMISSQTTIHSDTASDKVHLKDSIASDIVQVKKDTSSEVVKLKDDTVSETVQLKEDMVSKTVQLEGNTVSETPHLKEGISDTVCLQEDQHIVKNEPPIKTERKRKSLGLVKTSEMLKDINVPKDVQPKLEEVTIATQTDPLPEGLVIEDVQQTVSDTQLQESITEIKPCPLPEVPVTSSAIPEKIIQTVIEKTVVVMPDPDTEIEFLKTKKLQVSELDVEKLNVSELQAQKITVSDIEGVTMQVSELTSRGGNLVVSGIEIPPSLLQSLTPPQPPAPLPTPPTQPTVIIRECVQQSTQTTPPPLTVNSQTNTSPDSLQEKIEFPSSVSTTSTSQKPEKLVKESIQYVQQPLKTECLPSAPTGSISHKPEKIAKETIQYVQQPPSIIVESLDGQSSQVFVPDHIATTPQITKIQTPQKTRAHVSTTQPIPGFEGSIEAESRQRHHHSPQHSQFVSDTAPYVSQNSPEQDVTATELIKQLIRIWQSNFVHGMDRVIDTLNSAFPEGEKRRDAQTAACIVLVLILLLLIVGIGSDKTVHIHHWDYVPPRP